MAVGRTVAFYQDWLAHHPDDPWWDVIDFTRELSRVPPVTMLAGWYDMFLPAQLDDFVALRAAGREVRLTIGPWTHTSPAIMERSCATRSSGTRKYSPTHTFVATRSPVRDGRQALARPAGLATSERRSALAPSR